MNARRVGSVLAGVALAALLGWGGCSLQPEYPNGSVACASDDQCPRGFVCGPISPHAPEETVCCRGKSCGDPNQGPRPDASPPLDDGEPPPGDGPEENDPDQVDVTCSSNASMPLPSMSGREVYCTIDVMDHSVYLGIDAITMNDPVSTRAHAVCRASIPLADETMDPDGNKQPLSAATLDAVVNVVQRYQQICRRHGARVVGALARSWARAATNQSEVVARFQEGTGLALDVPTIEQALVHRYYGATRYRRGRMVLDMMGEQSQIVAWPVRTAAPMVVIPTGINTAGAMYFSGSSDQSFGEARSALRSKLLADSASGLGELAAGVQSGALSPSLVGPGDPLVPLAIGGQLRTMNGAWFDADLWKAADANASASSTPDGTAYGVVLPATISSFLTSLDAKQFEELRENPIRDAYGLRLLYQTTLLELIAEQTKATEVVFVFTNPHFGYLFTKVLPPPPG